MIEWSSGICGMMLAGKTEVIGKSLTSVSYYEFYRNCSETEPAILGWQLTTYAKAQYSLYISCIIYSGSRLL
jgi:hypothetical protein